MEIFGEITCSVMQTVSTSKKRKAVSFKEQILSKDKNYVLI